ncbi:MAG: hypothetical protein QOH14_3843, partial [Pseudonocardiales bacterium]|nr:hypothetical protein [Pseudonocardiales bacterium]
MPDDAPGTEEGDAAEVDALASDARLLRRVRWRLVAWSGLTTFAVLLVLGAALYLIASRTLEDRGITQLENRVQPFRGISPDVDSPGLGFIFGGGGSGTFAMVLDEAGV